MAFSAVVAYGGCVAGLYTPSGPLLRWYARGARPLPWRRTTDPYAILVSEMMAQQTQVSRVLPAYLRFLRRFPTLAALSQASLAEVLREWSGLGYNRRARDLHRIARAHPNGLPRTVAALDALPGIGAYTAGAIACFAHGDPVPFADTNIRRVLGRVFLGRVATEREAVTLDRDHLPARAAARWHSALMDLGAAICSARAPQCHRCPLRTDCEFKRAGAAPADRASATKHDGYAASDRRVRGRIVALLAAAPDGLTPAALRNAIGDARVPLLIEALIADGLLERHARRVRLPE
ncbi:MAG TPA: A/G-specific adenine glycosylase [Candidatus Limnocylindria bacterium]|jgi:A/G-specific adenine glycosylase